MLLVGDIGGTKTNLAFFEKEGDDYNYFQPKTFHSQNYSDLIQIIQEYLNTTSDKIPVHGACFAIAGPIYDDVCKATNLPWIVEKKRLCEALGTPRVFLINDLEANAHAVDILPKENLSVIHAGHNQRQANRCVVSPGTGLGEAGIYWDGDTYHPFACEGGHTDFAPRNHLEMELLNYLFRRFGHASYERVLSGPGLYTLYQFFIEVKKREESPQIKEEMKVKDPAAVITDHAFKGTSPVCLETLNLFISILGSEAGNCALKFLALGGVYLGGGIPPKVLPKLKEPEFLSSFVDKGRFRAMLEEIPLLVILDDKASLKGAAHYWRLRTQKDLVKEKV